MSNKSIIRWFDVAKPEPTNQDLLKQIAFHCEEFAEMLDAIHCDYMAEQVRNLQTNIMYVAEDAKQADNFVSTIGRLALLDACADQVVTATGVATLAGMDFEPALAEVNRSNWTKFNTDGTPYIRPDGKIGKNPETYQEPQLSDYVSLADRQQRTKDNLLAMLEQAESNTPAPYTSKKITVERIVTEVETYEIHPEQLGEFIDCDECRLTVDFGQPTGEFYSDKRRVLTNGDQE